MTISIKYLKFVLVRMVSIAMVGMLAMFSMPASALTITFDLQTSSVEELISIRNVINERLADFEGFEEETAVNPLEERAFEFSSLHKKHSLPILKEGIPLLKDYFKNPNSVEIISAHGKILFDDDGNTSIGGQYIFDILAENSFGGNTTQRYACTYYTGSGEWEISSDELTLKYAEMFSMEYDAATIEWINSLLK